MVISQAPDREPAMFIQISEFGVGASADLWVSDYNHLGERKRRWDPGFSSLL